MNRVHRFTITLLLSALVALSFGYWQLHCQVLALKEQVTATEMQYRESVIRADVAEKRYRDIAMSSERSKLYYYRQLMRATIAEQRLAAQRANRFLIDGIKSGNEGLQAAHK